MGTNPINRPMTKLVEDSVAGAKHLRGDRGQSVAAQYKAGVGLAKLLAGQIDNEINSVDPTVINRLHMRVIPNFARALASLGLTPESLAKINGAGGRASAPAPIVPDAPVPEEADEPAEPETDALDGIIAELDNVVRMEGRK